ncbi:MAG: amylo-alpha-1,6-glucosidase [Gemmatimonadales bacterium]
MTAPRGDRFYIVAAEERNGDRSRVLKQGETFAVFDRHGDMRGGDDPAHGIYCGGTRMVSRRELLLNGAPPQLLSSRVKNDNSELTVDLTNPDMSEDGKVVIPRGTLHIARSILLWELCCYERIRIANHGLDAVNAVLTLRFDADFADIFEVRGTARAHRGERRAAAGAHGVAIRYSGLDKVERITRITSDPVPDRIRPREFRYELTLEPQEMETLLLTWTFEIGGAAARPVQFDSALRAACDAVVRERESDCRIETSNEQFNSWLDRSSADIHMMITQTPQGPYPYAGVPWYSTPFGRDAIITALEYLWINPDLAAGVLGFLARTQADRVIPDRDAEPGKILHEARDGEMAALGEVPFDRYYGAADTTPLFVVLAGAHFSRTGDRELAERMWPHVTRALGWIQKYGDADGDGFVEYRRRASTGLVNQGWKDSHDAIFHADGRLAEAPIAVCEIQGYVVAAYRAAGRLAEALGHADEAAGLAERADRLRQDIETRFWCNDIGTYALALDGAKRQCCVRASNAGHLLFCGVPTQEHAERTAATLLSEGFYSGWGIRTVGIAEARFNPMSYHNGSVWPHDNALIGAGFSRYGIRSGAMQVLSGLFEASTGFELYRMPELFCGFPRRGGEGPTAYPVACAPQSWSAASVFLMMQGCIGLTISAPRREVQFRSPELPPWLDLVRIRGLRVGDARLDLDIRREGDDIGITIARREGHVAVVVVK